MPSLTIESFEEVPKIEHNGDLVINCSIPAGLEIYVENGNVTVNGDVGKGATIRLEAKHVIKTSMSINGSSFNIPPG